MKKKPYIEIEVSKSPPGWHYEAVLIGYKRLKEMYKAERRAKRMAKRRAKR